MNRFWQRRRWLAWVAVVVFPLVINAPALLGFIKSDPIYRYALLTDFTPGPVNTINASFDPSIGLVLQPLGHRAADMLVHGQLPWWNSYQGLGAPLIGEMSPGAIYPLIFLELLPNGQTILDVAVQVFAGIFTLLLARRIGLGLLGGSIAAFAFEANGTFAWLNSGWCYPLPLLPLLLYGIELCFGSLLRERILGSILVAVAIAVSITGAMFEVAFLDGLLGVAWALLRLGQTRGTKLAESATRLIFGALAGLLLAAPPLLAFIDYLNVSYVGSHTGDWVAVPFDPVALGQMISPYLIGPNFYHDSGYAGVALVCFAICGAFGRRLRGVRLMLCFWVFVAVAATIGVPLVQDLFAKIPGVRFTAYNRYLDGSWELALSLLAGFYLSDLVTDRAGAWVRCATATAFVIVPFTLWGGQSRVATALAQASDLPWFWSSVAWGVLVLALMWLTVMWRPLAKRAPIVVSAALVLEMVVAYTMPTFGDPTQAKLYDGSVNFLRHHLGLSRFITLGPIAANYGSYFDIATLDDAQLPVAKTWSDYELSHLDATISVPGTFMTGNENEILAHLENYENLGVRYVLISNTGTAPKLSSQSWAAKPIYYDPAAVIYELPRFAPYFSAPGCVVVARERDRLAAQCAHASNLRRLELYLPGWSATVNDGPVPVTSSDGLVQNVALPAGPSFIAFSFLPPYMEYGFTAFTLALLSLIYQLVVYVRLRRAERPGIELVLIAPQLAPPLEVATESTPAKA